jgi:hypothetical protein
MTPRYQAFSDNANVDLPSDESAFADPYQATPAGRGAKRRLVVRVDAEGKYVGLGLALVTDAKAIYEANAAYRRNLKPVDPNEIVLPPCAFQREDGTWASWMEMLPALIRQWELSQAIDESSYPLVRRAA